MTAKLIWVSASKSDKYPATYVMKKARGHISKNVHALFFVYAFTFYPCSAAAVQQNLILLFNNQLFLPQGSSLRYIQIQNEK